MTTQLYRPSNGTEGDCFFAQWCCQCARDNRMNGTMPFDECADDDNCEILMRTMQHDVTEDEYPREWIIGEHGPCCTAFIRAGEEIKHRCTQTIDMFNVEN